MGTYEIYDRIISKLTFSFIDLCRIHFVKSISKRKEKDILLLKARLDEYNDEWRTADTSDTASNNFPSLIRTSAQNKSKKYTPRKYKKNTDNANSSKNNDGVTTNGTAKEKEPKPRKRQKSVMWRHCIQRIDLSLIFLSLFFTQTKEPKRASNQFIPSGVGQQQQWFRSCLMK